MPLYKIEDEFMFYKKNTDTTITMKRIKNIRTVIVIEETWDIISTGLLLSYFIKMLFVNAKLML
jgi:hypothetical protein